MTNSLPQTPTTPFTDRGDIIERTQEYVIIKRFIYAGTAPNFHQIPQYGVGCLLCQKVRWSPPYPFVKSCDDCDNWVAWA